MKGIFGAVGALVFNHREAGGAEDAPSKPSESPAVKCTVLVIDDDQTMLDLIRPLLRTEGFNVLTAQSGPKGLDMIRYAQRDVRVVLLDYNMPRFNGGDTLQYLRKLAPGAKVVALTGVAPELLPEEYKASVDRTLAKPFRSADLVACIHEVLGITPATAGKS